MSLRPCKHQLWMSKTRFLCGFHSVIASLSSVKMEYVVLWKQLKNIFQYYSCERYGIPIVKPFKGKIEEIAFGEAPIAKT
jgi:hypothetical protein